MKDGRTHLAHKPEHAVDFETGAVLEVTLRGADQGDTTTVVETLAQAGENTAELIRTEEPMPQSSVGRYGGQKHPVRTDRMQSPGGRLNIGLARLLALATGSRRDRERETSKFLLNVCR